MNTYIYVIAASEQGPCKIGYSADPEKRLRQLQTGHAQQLYLYHMGEFPTKKVRLAERAIHRTIKHDKAHGEWFDISVQDAVAEVEFARIHWGD